MCTTILIHCTTLFYDLTNIHMHGRRIKGGGGKRVREGTHTFVLFSMFTRY